MSDGRNQLLAKALAALHEDIGHTAAEDPQKAQATYVEALDPEKVSAQLYEVIDNKNLALHMTLAYFVRFFADKPEKKTHFTYDPSLPETKLSLPVKPKTPHLLIANSNTLDENEITVEPMIDAAEANAQAAEASGPEENHENFDALDIMNQICDLIAHEKFIDAEHAGKVLEEFITLLAADSKPGSNTHIIKAVLAQIQKKEKSIAVNDDTKKILAEHFHKALAIANQLPANGVVNAAATAKNDDDDVDALAVINQLCDIIEHKKFDDAEYANKILVQLIKLLSSASESAAPIFAILLQIRKNEPITVEDATKKLLTQYLYQARTAIPAFTFDPQQLNDAKKTPDNHQIILQKIKKLLRLKPNPDDDDHARVIINQIRQFDPRMEDLLNGINNSSTISLDPKMESILDSAYFAATESLPANRKAALPDDNSIVVAAEAKPEDTDEVTYDKSKDQQKRQRIRTETRNEFALLLTGLSYDELARVPVEEQKQAQTAAINQIDGALSDLLLRIINATLIQETYTVITSENSIYQIFVGLMNLIQARHNEIKEKEAQLMALQIRAPNDDDAIAELKSSIAQRKVAHTKELAKFIKYQGKKRVLPEQLVLEMLDGIHQFYLVKKPIEAAPEYFVGHQRSHDEAPKEESKVVEENRGIGPLIPKQIFPLEMQHAESVTVRYKTQKKPKTSAAGPRPNLSRASTTPETKREEAGRSIAYLMNDTKSGTTTTMASAAKAAGVVVAAPVVAASMLQADPAAQAHIPKSTTAATNTKTSFTKYSLSPKSAFALVRKEIEGFKRGNLNPIKTKKPEASAFSLAELGLGAGSARGALNLSSVPPTLSHTATSALAANILSAPDATLMTLTASASKEQGLKKKKEAPQLSIAALTDAALAATASVRTTASAATTQAALSTALAVTASAAPNASAMALAAQAPKHSSAEHGVLSRDLVDHAAAIAAAIAAPQPDDKMGQQSAAHPIIDTKIEALLGEAKFLQSDIDELIQRARKLAAPYVYDFMLAREYNIEDLETAVTETISRAESQVRPFCEKFAIATHATTVALPIKPPFSGDNQKKLEDILKNYKYLNDKLNNFYKAHHTDLDQKLNEFQLELNRQLDDFEPEAMADSQAGLAGDLSGFDIEKPKDRKALNKKLDAFKQYLTQYYKDYYEPKERERLLIQLEQQLKTPNKSVIHELIQAIRNNKVQIQKLQKELKAADPIIILRTRIIVCLAETKKHVDAVSVALDEKALPKYPTPQAILALVDSLRTIIRENLNTLLNAMSAADRSLYNTAIELILLLKRDYEKTIREASGEIGRFADQLRKLKNEFIIAINQFVNDAKVHIEKKKANLDEKKATLEKQKVNLNEQKAELEKQKADLEEQKADLEKQNVNLEKDLPSALKNTRIKEGLISILKLYANAYIRAHGINADVPKKLAQLIKDAEGLKQKNTNDVIKRARFEDEFNKIKQSFIVLLAPTIHAMDITIDGKLHIKYHTHPTVAKELATTYKDKDLNYISKDLIEIFLQLLNDNLGVKDKDAQRLQENIKSNLRYVLALDLRNPANRAILCNLHLITDFIHLSSRLLTDPKIIKEKEQSMRANIVANRCYILSLDLSKETDRAILFRLRLKIEAEPECWFNKNITPAGASVPSAVGKHVVLHRAVTAIVTQRDARVAAAAAGPTAPARSPTH